jgi:hypothetical protein
VSILHLSDLWNFETMRTLAITRLSLLTSPIDRVLLARKYGVDVWLLPAYQQICEREAWLSDEEGRQLGIDDVMKIGRARQSIRDRPRNSSRQVVEQIFGITPVYNTIPLLCFS